MWKRVPNTKEITRRIENFRISGGDTLDLSNLYMIEIPAEVKDFKSLVSLDVNYNQLESLHLVDSEALTLIKTIRERVEMWAT